jgi:GNAT superfamily N-acetyltransferase
MSTMATDVSQAGVGRSGPDVRLRPFDGEYEQLIAIQKAIDPDEGGNADEWRFHDAHWRDEIPGVGRFWRLRLVAEAPGGEIAGWGQVQNMPWQYHPDKYGLDLEVHPMHQRHGVGSALYQRLTGALRERSALCVRAGVKESRQNGLDFAAHRGFDEIQRYWESRLDVAGFDFGAFAGAEPRAAGHGITFTTLAEELHGRSPDDPSAAALLQGIYEVDMSSSADIPFPEPFTPSPFDEWLTHAVKAPGVLLDAFFLAKHGERYVGLSNMMRNPDRPDVVHQGYTGVTRDSRGQGVAMALKLQTVRYAREHGYREIRTFNNTRNRPMLRINEAMGFAKQPVWIEFEKPLR